MRHNSSFYYLFLQIISLLLIHDLKAQEVVSPIICASDLIHERLMLEDINYREEALEQETKMRRYISEAHSMGRSSTTLVIPIVVHVMHTGESIGTGSNISDAQIMSAIAALNDDYRKTAGTSGDGDGVDTEIEFCLASTDPAGSPTTGINRINASTVPNYAEDGITAGQGTGADESDVKSLSRWNRDDYYNIWVVSEVEGNNGGSGIQGFAYFPYSSASVDGTVILYNAIGTEGTLKSYTNLNKVLSHELGHAFFLYHSFEGGSCTESDCLNQGDRVCDTPPTTFNSNCNSPACDGAQQVENYMDYSNQTCMDMFTQGQKDRMREAILNMRPSLITSTACSQSIPPQDCLGDIDGDTQVDISDFLLFNSSMGVSCSDCLEDLNEDGIIDTEDFLMLNGLFGTDCEE